MRILYARIALFAIGVLVWGYGANVDDQRVRWIGIALLAAALVLRFFSPRRPPAGRG